jgi:omega-6 fatty acid desaturase (delta-12 desaturase)
MPTRLLDPVSPVAPIPHGKIVRSWLSPAAKHDTCLALLLAAFDLALFGTAIAATVWFQNSAVKLLFSLIAGFMIDRLFTSGAMPPIKA